MTDAAGARKHIVVINDSPDILNLFHDILTDEGYRVTTDTFTFETGALLRHIQSLAPDLVILDLIIGGEEMGWQLLQLMKMTRAAKGIPVIVCTGSAKRVEELSTHLSNIGVGVILKPFDIDRLISLIGLVWEGGKFPQHADSERYDGPPGSSDG